VDGAAWLIKAPAAPLGGSTLEVGADGLLGRLAFGRAGGAAVICQIDPRSLDADRFTYLRYTRWRQARALSQLLANCGATFQADKDIFAPATASAKDLVALYHPDYRTDFAKGDNPYRTFGW
jgi:hypothetical protein